MAANLPGQEQMAVDLSEDEKKLEMALERSKQEQEPKVVMADEGNLHSTFLMNSGDDEDSEVDEDSEDDEDIDDDEDSNNAEDIDDDEDSNNAEDNVNPRAMVAASVVQRQQNDPELKEKIHKLEINFWANRISRDHYNNERFKLYTKEEAKAGRTLWPNSFMHSPVGHREGQHAS
ncbi:unnamed protein product [Calypogeia fissa]